MWGVSILHFVRVQASLRRGSAVSWDHAQLVHEQWLLAAMSSMQLFIVRVGTHDNIADLPSREARRLSAGCLAGYVCGVFVVRSTAS